MPARRALRLFLPLAMGAPVTAAAIWLFAASAPLTGCIPQPSCNAVCAPSFGVNAHVAATAAQLAGGTVTFCRNGDCGSAALEATSDAGLLLQTALDGTFEADVQVEDEADGYSVIEISLDVAGLTLANGDIYSVKVTGAQGATLLGVSRAITYETIQSCGSSCQVFTMNVYPASASGIACGDKSCTSGIELTGMISTADTTDPVSIALCRNAVCGSGSVTLGSDAGVQHDALLGPGLPAWAIFTPGASGDGAVFSFEIARSDDGEALADGDEYSLVISQGASVLVSWASAVTYETTYPNGPCDVVPCRLQTVRVP